MSLFEIKLEIIYLYSGPNICLADGRVQDLALCKQSHTLNIPHLETTEMFVMAGRVVFVFVNSHYCSLRPFFIKAVRAALEPGTFTRPGSTCFSVP